MFCSTQKYFTLDVVDGFLCLRWRERHGGNMTVGVSLANQRKVTITRITSPCEGLGVLTQCGLKDCCASPPCTAWAAVAFLVFTATRQAARDPLHLYTQPHWRTARPPGRWKKSEFYIPSSFSFKDLGTFYRTGIERLESGSPGRRHIPSVPVGRMKGPSRPSFQLIQPASSSPARQTIPLVNCWYGNSLSLLLVYC